MLIVLGAFLALAFHHWVWIPALALGLILNAAVLLFWGKAMKLMALRCGELHRNLEAGEEKIALLRSTLDATDDGILISDANGRALDFNPSFLRLWGIPPNVMEAGDDGRRQDFMLAQLKDPDTFQSTAQELLRNQVASSFDTVDLWDGRVFERSSAALSFRGAPVARAWRFREVTAQAKADRFIQRLSQAVEQSPVTIIITDTAGTIEFVNPRFTQLTGYELDEGLGQNPRIFQSGLTPAAVYEEMWATITGGEVWVGEFQNRKKNGDLFWERATISPLRDQDGVITHYLGMKEDISPQKQLEQQLRHSQKLEAVGLLAGGVAHDFNNILQVINGYGTLIQIGQAPDDPNRASLAEILKAAERAAQLTHSLLAFSRKQVMNPRTLDLNTLVGNVEKLLRRIIGEDVELVVSFGADPLTVHVDLGQMEQVLLNLATNARDAMPSGGTLEISTERISLDAQFRKDYGFGQPGDYALLQVKDTGEGMAEETLKRIFDPFFTTREMGRGTGLGLAMVYGIIKQQNGYIMVESGGKVGSVFKVYLPIAMSAPNPVGGPALQESRMMGSENILVVEDEPAVRSFMEIVLKKYGYSVLLAEDGQAAVEMFQARRDAIDMILMDMIMPRKSGRQAYEEIRQQSPDVKVLFTSGYTADFIQSRGELGQGMELLMKPVQPFTLLRKIREILDRDERAEPGPTGRRPQGTLGQSDNSPDPAAPLA